MAYLFLRDARRQRIHIPTNQGLVLEHHPGTYRHRRIFPRVEGSHRTTHRVPHFVLCGFRDRPEQFLRRRVEQRHVDVCRGLNRRSIDKQWDKGRGRGVCGRGSAPRGSAARGEKPLLALKGAIERALVDARRQRARQRARQAPGAPDALHGKEVACPRMAVQGGQGANQTRQTVVLRRPGQQIVCYLNLVAHARVRGGQDAFTGYRDHNGTPQRVLFQLVLWQCPVERSGRQN